MEIFFTNEGKMKTFSEKQQVEEIIITVALQEMLTAVLQVEERCSH